MPELSSKRSKRESFLSFQPPAISEDEIEAVSETLRSGWLTTGPRTAELEARMREYLEASTSWRSRPARPRSTSRWSRSASAPATR